MSRDYHPILIISLSLPVNTSLNSFSLLVSPCIAHKMPKTATAQTVRLAGVDLTSNLAAPR